jgi:hypothetical protein
VVTSSNHRITTPNRNHTTTPPQFSFRLWTASSDRTPVRLCVVRVTVVVVAATAPSAATAAAAAAAIPF